ncbi:MAG: alpha/beta hydrolase family protein [Lachnospiraceae bacterium]
MHYEIEVKELGVSTEEKNIFGKLFVPKNKTGRLPAVILSHGYNSSHEDVEDVAMMLAREGILAYSFDYCGGSVRSKSSGSSLEMSIQTEIADLKAVTKLIAGLEDTDSSKIGLYGESQGGFVSALTAAENPQAYSALFLLYPAFCIPDDWKKRCSEGVLSPTFDLMGMTLSDKFFKGLPDYDVFERIKRFEKPVFIVHGDRDGLVPLSYSERVAASMPESELHIFENEGHGLSSLARIKLVKQVCEFFADNIL